MDTSGKGKVIMIVGGKGTGKTTVAREMLEKANPNARMVYDVEDHYNDLYNRPLVDVDEFKEATTKVSQAVIVFEEATMFFPNRGYDKLAVNFLVRSRNRNNLILLLYHSLRAIPLYMIDHTNYIRLFKTTDTPKKIDNKFEREDLNAMFLRVQKHPNIHYTETLKVL